MAQIAFPQEQVTTRKARKGGGQFGQVLGALAGGAAAAASGGAAGAIIGGAAGGSSLGGLIGGSLQPGRAASISQPQQQRGIQTPSGAVDRRLQEIEKNPHFQLKQAQAALPQLSPEIQKQFAPTIEAALAASLKAQKVGVA